MRARRIALSFVIAYIFLAESAAFAASTEARYAAIKAEYLKFLKSEVKKTYRHNWMRHIDAFLAFRKRAPKSARADDALYMAAEGYAGLYEYSATSADLRKAVNYYNQTAKLYPKSNLADDALLKSGEALEILNDAAAVERYEKCVKSFPKSDSAPSAKKALARLKKPAPKTAKAAPPPKPLPTPTPAPATAAAEETPVPAADDDTESVIVAEPLFIGDALDEALGEEETDEEAIAPIVEGALDEETPESGGPTLVRSVQHWSNPDYTRIVIETTAKTPFEYHLLEQAPGSSLPRRLFVDFKKSKLAKRLAKEESITIADGLLQRARVGQYQEDVVRVVLDIESIDDFQVFPMLDPFRVVIDVKGKSKVEPTPPPSKSKRRWTVVIDPGHGGTDPGAMSRKGDKEALMTLAIAKLVQRDLAKDERIRAVLSRNRDYFITLPQRPAIANKADADLFVSIHINAAGNRNASGIEVFHFAPRARREDAELVAAENATTSSSVMEYDDILAGLTLSYRKIESNNLASMVFRHMLTQTGGLYDDVEARKVRSAPFYVLMGTRMPAILVECGFITNATELARLKTSKYQQALARGIADGVRAYFAEFD